MRVGMTLEPFYQDDHVTLYHGDALKHPELWVNADVLVTDPPYGTQTIGDREGGYGRRGTSPAGQFLRNSPKDRIGAIIVGDQDTTVRDEALALWGEKKPAVVFGSPRMPDPPGVWEDRLVWNKTRPGMNGGAVRYMHEQIFGRGLQRANNHTFSVLTAYPDQKHHIHAKPLPVMETLVSVCPPGVIVDPFAGSGSTLVAGKQLGRKVIGFEIEPTYCKLIVERLATQTPSLFNPDLFEQPTLEA